MNQDSPHDEEQKKQRAAFYKATRRIMLAGIGAAMLAQEEIENFINRLIERGEMAEIDARRLIREVKERRERLERKQKAAAGKPEIDMLVERINELTRQVEELKRQKTGPDIDNN
jgi:polyhydroxyalkanoate synthesis regulator phasin